MIRKWMKKLLAPVIREVIKDWEKEVTETTLRLVRGMRDDSQ